MEQFEQIRRDRDREGLSIRALAERYGVHRRAVRQALASPLPPAKRAPERRSAPKLGEYRELIDEWLVADLAAPRKQRHTAKRVWRRLVDEHGVEVAETTVRDHVRKRRRALGLAAREVFVPQIHAPGVTAEVDWGQADVDLAGARTRVHLFFMRSCFSGAAFSMASPVETQQAFLEGHAFAFEWFDGVFAEVRYDNLGSAVKQVLKGRRRVESDRFVALRSHYLFDSLGGFKRSLQHLDVRSGMGRPAGWMKGLTGRSAMKSPGHPSHRRDMERWFWREVAKGLSSEDAAAVVGVSTAAGSRWFRERGGMATLLRDPSSCRYLCFEEREEIALLRAEGRGVREIAREIGRSPSMISRELRRNAATRGAKLEYRASVAQWKAELVARRPKTAKLAGDDRLREYVAERLAGQVRRPDGTAAAGPSVKAWKGRGKPHRADRRWAKAWSPEQISARLEVDFPDDLSMRISHEAIYQSLFVQGRGALQRELTACLRTGRALRVPRARVGQRSKGHVSDEVMISQRPAEAEDRAVPGHWEGDLIIGTGRSAIGTLVERSSRFTLLLHLPVPDGAGPRVKHGPPVTGAGAEQVRDAIASQLGALSGHLRRSLTWDQGKEMAQHARLRIDTGLEIYFCDPQSPWQRATNENTNGLLRQYFPRGTDLARHTAEDLAAVADALNGRPRKTLGWRTPAEVLNEHLTAAA